MSKAPTKHPMEIASAQGRKDFNRASDPLKAKQAAADKAKRRESFMVKRQQPKPALRPGPQLSMGPDSAAFNQAWEKERKNAVSETKPQTKEGRKTAFIEARKGESQQKTRTPTRSK